MVKLAITNRKILAVASAILSILLILSVYFIYSDTLNSTDNSLLDLFFRVRGPVDAGKDIAIVGLDVKSAETIGRKASGWSRSDFAKAIRILSGAGADLIGVDYKFTIGGDPREDQDLASTIQDSSNVILASFITNEDKSFPYENFRQQEVGEGFLNVIPDDDGIIRRIPTLGASTPDLKTAEIYLPFSFAVALARLYPDGDYKPDLDHKDFVQFRNVKVPYALSGKSKVLGFYINFAGPAGTFHKYSILQIFQKQFDPADIKGKIVLIGNMSPFEHDYYRVPFPSSRIEDQEIQKEGMGSMYGVEIHANMIRTLLTGKTITPASKASVFFWFALLSAIAIWLALVSRWNAFVNSGLSLAILFAFGAYCYWMFLRGNFLPVSSVFFCVIGITIAGLIARQASEEFEKRYITQMFGRYLAPNVVKELIAHRDLIQLAGRKERLTMFFSDIRGFTSMSEKLQPEEVSAILNEYFKRMTKVVFKHRGTLDKFMGDAIMAFFGNPLHFPDHAREAVDMAIDMRDEMDAMLQFWKNQGKEYTFGIGMGVNTGEVVVGNLGSDDFFDYTVIGDDVNLACRLESIAKKSQILISASTYEEVKDFFEVNQLEPVTVKGKSKPVQVYEVIGRKSL